MLTYKPPISRTSIRYLCNGRTRLSLLKASTCNSGVIFTSSYSYQAPTIPGSLKSLLMATISIYVFEYSTVVYSITYLTKLQRNFVQKLIVQSFQHLIVKQAACRAHKLLAGLCILV